MFWFREQVKSWPKNPVDLMLRWLRSKPTDYVVGDFGCGDAAIAEKAKNKVHSFDLVSRNERVTACDIANVPLADNTLDVAIFCLSLMGTNFMDFIREANRTLKMKYACHHIIPYPCHFTLHYSHCHLYSGTLKIAEVNSRFDTSGKEDGAAAATERGRAKFVEAIESFGFQKKAEVSLLTHTYTE